MKCVLHIGTEKTGSTVLQDWLYDVEGQLSEQGVYLSQMLGKTNNRLFPSYFQHDLDDWTRKQRIYSNAEKEVYFEGFLDKLAAEIKEASKSHDLFIISSEHLHSRLNRRKDIESIRTFLSQHFESVDVICYFRPQPEMAVSLYSTALKVSSYLSLDRFLDNDVNPENYYYNFKQIADNWSKVFGKENCKFQIYDRKKLFEQDLRKDFIRLLPTAIDSSCLNYKVASRNESLSGLMGGVYALINKYVPYWDDVNGGVNDTNLKLKDIVSNIDTLNHGKILSNSKQELAESFAESNEAFLAEYFTEDEAFGSSRREESNDLAFTYKQVEHMIEELLSALLPFVQSEASPRLFDQDAERLRDMALKVEKNNKLAMNEALYLMQLAQRARPTGPLIRNKVKAYSAHLDLEEA